MICPKCKGTGHIDGTLGDRIRALADARGISMPDVERGARLSHATLWRLLSAKNAKGASLESLTKLADFFGVSLDELVGRKRETLLGDTQTPIKKYFEQPVTYQPDRCGIQIRRPTCRPRYQVRGQNMAYSDYGPECR